MIRREGKERTARPCPPRRGTAAPRSTSVCPAGTGAGTAPAAPRPAGHLPLSLPSTGGRARQGLNPRTRRFSSTPCSGCGHVVLPWLRVGGRGMLCLQIPCVLRGGRRAAMGV